MMEDARATQAFPQPDRASVNLFYPAPSIRDSLSFTISLKHRDKVCSPLLSLFCCLRSATETLRLLDCGDGRAC